MLITVANALFDRLIDAFPPSRPYGRSDLYRDPMPAAVSAYLEQLLSVKLQEIVDSDLPDDAWVDKYAREVKEARETYLAAMQRHQAIPATEWADALRTSCHDTLRYLVRPAATLSDRVFPAGASSVRAADVRARTAFYEPYPYFQNVVEAYFEQKEASRIDRERFEGLVRRTDQQMTSDFSARQWRRLLDPLVAVLSAAGRRDVPAELLKSFFEEKDAVAPLRKLVPNYGLEGTVPFEDLEDLFVVVERPEPARSGDDRPTQERPSARSTERADTSVPLWKQFEHGYSSTASDKQENDKPLKNGVSEPLWKQFRKTPEPPRVSGKSSLGDLERSVLGERGARNRDLFVEHLFSGRPDDYEATLRRLAHAGDWSQASQIIAQEVFLKHQVNIYSDPAVAFTDAAESQYRS